MSAAGPLPKRSYRSAQGGGCLMSAAGPLPKRSYRSAQGGGCLMSAAGPLPTANSAMRSMEDA
jgi:hypothetical protein